MKEWWRGEGRYGREGIGGREGSCTSVLDLNPPNAHPFHCRPVTSWNGRVAISWPAGATPVAEGEVEERSKERGRRKRGRRKWGEGSEERERRKRGRRKWGEREEKEREKEVRKKRTQEERKNELHYSIIFCAFPIIITKTHPHKLRHTYIHTHPYTHTYDA